MDQSGFYLLPTVVRTYAPIGKTPILHEQLSRDHLSAMSGITLEGKLLMMEQERERSKERMLWSAFSSMLCVRLRATRCW